MNFPERWWCWTQTGANGDWPQPRQGPFRSKLSQFRVPIRLPGIPIKRRPLAAGRKEIMKVLVAGATWAIGRPLVVELIERGHEVTGMTRSESKRKKIEWWGAKSVVADALDPEAVARAVAEAEPDVIVHELTSIGPDMDLRHPDRTFGPTNELRTKGTDHLLSAARAAGVRRFVAQSFAPLIYERTGSLVKTEEDPVDTHPDRWRRRRGLVVHSR